MITSSSGHHVFWSLAALGKLRLQSWTYELHTATWSGFYGNWDGNVEGRWTDIVELLYLLRETYLPYLPLHSFRCCNRRFFTKAGATVTYIATICQQTWCRCFGLQCAQHYTQSILGGNSAEKAFLYHRTPLQVMISYISIRERMFSFLTLLILYCFFPAWNANWDKSSRTVDPHVRSSRQGCTGKGALLWWYWTDPGFPLEIEL